MGINYLLDTNICIYFIKGKPLLQQRLTELKVGTVAMSIITYGELYYGVEKSLYPKKNLEVLKQIKHFIPVLQIPCEAGKYYGEVRTKLEKQGKMIGNNDLWIAAHALSLDIILVTNNTKEFTRIPHLKLENWVN